LIVTSSGAGLLFVVTLPKSNVAGTTWMVGLVAGGGVGVGAGGAGAGPGLGALPPELHPTTVKVAAAKSTGRIDERCFMTDPIPSSDLRCTLFDCNEPDCLASDSDCCF
jgi:hypothetical protein